MSIPIASLAPDDRTQQGASTARIRVLVLLRQLRDPPGPTATPPPAPAGVGLA